MNKDLKYWDYDEENQKTFFVETWEINGLLVETRKTKKRENAEFLPAVVSDQSGRIFWNFKEDVINFNGLAKLREYKDEYYIILESQARELCQLIPLSYLPISAKTVMPDGEVVLQNNKNPLELIQLKKDVARFLRIRFSLTAREEKLQSKQIEIYQAQQAKLRQQEIEAKALQEAAHRAKIEEIKNRKRISVHIGGGERRNGVPVIDGEWECLPNNFPIVRLDNKEGFPAEFFFVVKGKNGRPEKKGIRQVVPEEPRKTVVNRIPKIKQELFFMIDGKLEVINHYDEANFQLLRQTEVNGGTKVVRGESEADGRYHIYELMGKESRPFKSMIPV